MWIFWLIFAGIIGGIIGGMGMGGGTLLIPILVTFLGIKQHSAQAINLIVFVPMAVVTLVIHFRNKLVKIGYLFSIALPACVASIFAAFLIKSVSDGALKALFGWFLILLGVYQLACIVVEKIREKLRKNRDKKLPMAIDGGEGEALMSPLGDIGLRQ